MRQHKIFQDGCHERIGTLCEETVDPELKAASASELRAEYFVFGEDQEKHADSYAQSSKRARIPIGGHRPLIVSEQKKSANCVKPVSESEVSAAERRQKFWKLSAVMILTSD
jgi:RNase H-fold protein (predicted Holliday junction resolvase)